MREVIGGPSEIGSLSYPHHYLHRKESHWSLHPAFRILLGHLLLIPAIKLDLPI